MGKFTQRNEKVKESHPNFDFLTSSNIDKII